MLKRARLITFLALVGVFGYWGPAWAILFTASGTAGDGRPENATADFFNITSTGFDVTLKNTAGVGQLGGISSVLDGLIYTLSTPAAASVTAATSTNGTVNCSTGTCVFTAGPTTDNTTFFGWSVNSGNQLEAGGGSLKPRGIVNNNITTTDGIPNAQHNPYLNGPVTFHIALTGLTSAPTITGATFEFGTEPDSVVGVVPEPTSLLLAGTALVGIGAWARRRRAAAKAGRVATLVTA